MIFQGVRTLPLDLPSLPLTGWEIVTADNYKEKNIPRVMSGRANYQQATCILL